MRLTDYENEEALDLLADIIEPAAKIMSDKRVEEMVKSGKPVLIIAPYILKNHKRETIEIVASLHRESPDTYKFNAISLMRDLMSIINDPEIIEFFTSQSQNPPESNSGSATGNTMENGQ